MLTETHSENSAQVQSRTLVRRDLNLAAMLADRLALMRRPWMADALCAEHDRALFFAAWDDATTGAKAICGSCTVRAECLDYALADVALEGIWGGTSRAERRRIRRLAGRPDPHAPGRPGSRRRSRKSPRRSPMS